MAKRNLLNLHEEEARWTLKRLDLKKRLNLVLDYICHSPQTLNILFTNNASIQEKNFTYRQKNKATDVLSFPPLQAFPQGESSFPFLGDMILSVEFHLQEKEAHETLAFVLERSLIHGILHLKGFDHERGEDHHLVMMSLQDVIHQCLIDRLGSPLWIDFLHD